MNVAHLPPKEFGKRFLHEVTKDDISGLAAELSYRVFVALFPFFIFLAALGGFIAAAVHAHNPTEAILNQFGSALPGDARSLLRTQLSSVLESRNGGLLSFGFIGAAWAASGAMKGLMKALNRAYDVPETRPFWETTGVALALTLAGTVGILGAFMLLVATQSWGGEIAGWFHAGGGFKIVVALVRWPLVLALVLTAVAVIYWLAPNLHLPFKWISPGAVLFTLVWLAITVAFAVYVSQFGSYNKTYGTLGGVVVLLTWLYLTNLMLLAGAELNALLAELAIPAKVEVERGEAEAEAASQTREGPQPAAPA